MRCRVIDCFYLVSKNQLSLQIVNRAMNISEKFRIVLTAVLLLNLAYPLRAGNGAYGSENLSGNIWEPKTLFGDYFGFHESLIENGIEIDIGITGVYQQNIHGGVSTHNRAGRNSGSYDVGLSADFEKLLGIYNSGIIVHAEGGWPDSGGIDSVSVGSAFGVNADAIGNRALDIVELFYEGTIFGDSLNLMAGKIDFTWVFDRSVYADSESTQFLNTALVDNPTIPFPEYSLGVIITYSPAENRYLMGGVADAQADGRETGLRTTFHDEDYFLYILEAGLRQELDSTNGTLQGNYRVGIWNDPQPKSHSDAADQYRGDVGFYLSCDQMLIKENADLEDAQGLGAFFRYGHADGRKNDITNFWSAGFRYQGFVEARDDDVLGAGFAQGVFSNHASATYSADYESALELYYNAQVATWVNISPSVQYVTNPGGDKTAGDAVVLGVRAQIMF